MSSLSATPNKPSELPKAKTTQSARKHRAAEDTSQPKIRIKFINTTPIPTLDGTRKKKRIIEEPEEEEDQFYATQATTDSQADKSKQSQAEYNPTSRSASLMLDESFADIICILSTAPNKHTNYPLICSPPPDSPQSPQLNTDSKADKAADQDATDSHNNHGDDHQDCMTMDKNAEKTHDSLCDSHATQPVAHILIKGVERDKIKEATTKAKMLGIHFVSHPIYNQASKTVSLHVQDKLFKKSLNQLLTNYNSPGTIDSGELEQEEDNINTLALHFKPNQLPPTIEKQMIDQATRIHSIKMEDFTLTFINPNLYKIKTPSDHLAYNLRMLHNITIVGLDATIQSWRASLYAETFTVTISNIDPKTSWQGICHMIK